VVDDQVGQDPHRDADTAEQAGGHQREQPTAGPDTAFVDASSSSGSSRLPAGTAGSGYSPATDSRGFRFAVGQAEPEDPRGVAGPGSSLRRGSASRTA